MKRAELMDIFATLPEDELKVASDLISQAAFLAVSLEDLAEIISREGMTEQYSNGGNQSGRKISSNAKMYSALIGKYTVLVGKLLKLVPPPSDEKKELERELSRKMDEAKKDRENEYAQAAFDAYLEAVRKGEADHDHYTEFMSKWRSENPLEGSNWRRES